MRRMNARARSRLTLVVALVALSAFLFLMPARFTAPARVLFNEAAGPAETAAYQGAGQTLAATGTLSDMFRARDRQRALEREVVRLRNQSAALADELRRQQARIQSLQKLDLNALSHRAVRASVSAYDTSGMRRSHHRARGHHGRRRRRAWRWRRTAHWSAWSSSRGPTRAACAWSPTRRARCPAA